MITPFGPYEPLVVPSAAADDGGITALGERVDVMGSNFARGRPRLLNDKTFARLGSASAAGISFPTVKARGRLPIETLFSRPEVLGVSTYQDQNGSLPVGMTLVASALNYDMDRVRRFFPLASRRFAS
jgi:hypothetical protein